MSVRRKTVTAAGSHGEEPSWPASALSDVYRLPAPGARPRADVWFLAGLLGIFVLAVTVRLVGVLRGGGLYARGNYDDGVHFAAAMGLVNGLLPYRDFLLLHPPGVVLFLAPFALLSWVIGEPDAVAVARLSWMVLGGVNAVLCGLVLRPLSRLAGLVAALYYALSLGAIYVEHTTLLEPPATTLLLVALVLTRLLGSGDGIRTRHYVVAGLLLGVSPVLKIWGVVAILVVVGGIAFRRAWRPALITLGAATASCAAACLPFFLAAPVEMWKMVVVAQFNRRRTEERMAERLTDVLGTREWTGATGIWNHWLTATTVVLLVALVICVIRAELRVVAALMITHGALVLTTPMWFLHYAGLTSAPIALTIGGALAAAMGWTAGIRWLPPALAALTAGLVLILAVPMTRLDLGRPFPGQSLAAAVADHPGCLTTDWPMASLQMDHMQTDLDRRCPFVVDLGGYSYYLYDGSYADVSRRKNKDWQAFALEYYRSGECVIPIRFKTAAGYSKATARTIAGWPVIAKVDHYVVRDPQPAGG